MVSVVSAIERSLSKAGFSFSIGAGVAAVHKSLLEDMT